MGLFTTNGDSNRLSAFTIFIPLLFLVGASYAQPGPHGNELLPFISEAPAFASESGPKLYAPDFDPFRELPLPPVWRETEGFNDTAEILTQRLATAEQVRVTVRLPAVETEWLDASQAANWDLDQAAATAELNKHGEQDGWTQIDSELIQISLVNQESDKLAKIFDPEMLGIDLAYFERLTGPAKKTIGNTKLYRIDNCNVTANVVNGSIKSLRLDLSEDCTFDLNKFLYHYSGRFPPLHRMTFGDFSTITGGGDFFADCLIGCPNTADPIVYEYWQGSHADLDYLEVLLEISLSDDSTIEAAGKWRVKMRQEEGEEWIENRNFNCQNKYNSAALEAFGNVTVSGITLGYNITTPPCIGVKSNYSLIKKTSNPPSSLEKKIEEIKPAYMMVGPLPSGDLLNERAAPDATAPVVNRLAPGTLVAVGEQQINKGTKWRHRDGDGGGWLAEKYLRLAKFQLLGESSTPSFGSCGGFEPSWSLEWNPENIRVDLPDRQETRVITKIQQAEGYRHALIICGEDPRDRITFQFEEEACSYLPVDALLWGRGILTVVRDGETKQYLGCCNPNEKSLLKPLK